MNVVFLLEKSSKHFNRFIELLRSQSKVKIKDVKKVCSRSSYYFVIINRLYSINKALREVHPDLYLAEAALSTTEAKEVFTALKKCDLIQIESKEGFFILRYADAKD
ncbi:MAG: hypothetical protein HY363_04960 [Candidatus Aenigmarchaeota archaeon]|nr:hypothetical protein [Candidatus Aenigmarchaeota archaeon]